MGREMGQVSQYGTGVVRWILQEVEGRTPISREERKPGCIKSGAEKKKNPREDKAAEPVPGRGRSPPTKKREISQEESEPER